VTGNSRMASAGSAADPLVHGDVVHGETPIGRVIQAVAAGWNADEPWLAWAGECGDFAHVVWEAMREQHGTEVETCNSIDHLTTAAPPPGTTWEELAKLGVIADMWHVWVALDGRYYDAAHPEGVTQALELRAIRQGLVEAMEVLAEQRLCRLMQAHPWWVESMRLSEELGRSKRGDRGEVALTVGERLKMPTNRDIISNGRVATVSGAEIEELRTAHVSWFAYCQRRLTMSHADAVAALRTAHGEQSAHTGEVVPSAST